MWIPESNVPIFSLNSWLRLSPNSSALIITSGKVDRTTGPTLISIRI